MAISSELFNLLKKNNNSRVFSYVHLLELSIYLLEEDDLQTVFTYVLNPVNKTLYTNVVYILFGLPTLKKKFMALKGYSASFNKAILDAPMSLKKMSGRQNEDYLLFEFLHRRFLNVVDVYSKSGNSSPLFKQNDYETIKFSLEHIKFDEKSITILHSIIKKYPFLDLNLDKIFKNEKEETKNQFIKDNYLFLSLRDDYLHDFSPKEKIEYFIANKDKDGINYINEYIKEFKDNPGDVIKYLFFYTSFYSRKEQIKKILSQYEDNDYVLELFSCDGGK